jgi:hypothetical protein
MFVICNPFRQRKTRILDTQFKWERRTLRREKTFKVWDERFVSKQKN